MTDTLASDERFLEHELPAMTDTAADAAIDLVAARMRLKTEAFDGEQYEAESDAVLAGYYTGDERRDKFLNGFLFVALIDLAAEIYLREHSKRRAAR